MSRHLVACMLNVSEARRGSVVDAIAKAAVAAVNPPKRPPLRAEWSVNAAALNIFRDIDYNRSVITLVTTQDVIGECVEAGCRAAYQLIDLRQHVGVHPRLGAVDLVPLHPLSHHVSLDALGSVARGVAERLARDVPGTSFFLFGSADGQSRGLVERRKEIGWFRRPPHYADLTHDVGAAPAHRFGLTGVGAIPFMRNVNVTLDTVDLKLGRRVARAIRAATPGGLPGVQAMAFPHEGKVEVACNVDYLPAHLVNAPHQMVSGLGEQFLYTSPEQIRARVEREADGVSVVGTTLIGFSPEEAASLAVHAFTHALPHAWTLAKTMKM